MRFIDQVPPADCQCRPPVFYGKGEWKCKNCGRVWGPVDRWGGSALIRRDVDVSCTCGRLKATSQVKDRRDYVHWEDWHHHFDGKKCHQIARLH